MGASPASVPPAGSQAPGGSPFAAVVGEGATQGSVADEGDEDDEWVESEPSYTWLHYIILVVVAFVLGLLLWNLVLNGPDDENFEPDQATGPAAVLDVGSLR